MVQEWWTGLSQGFQVLFLQFKMQRPAKHLPHCTQRLPPFRGKFWYLCLLMHSGRGEGTHDKWSHGEGFGSQVWAKGVNTGNEIK